MFYSGSNTKHILIIRCMTKKVLAFQICRTALVLRDPPPPIAFHSLKCKGRVAYLLFFGNKWEFLTFYSTCRRQLYFLDTKPNSWSCILFEKPEVYQKLMVLPTFYGSRNFILTFTKTHKNMALQLKIKPFDKSIIVLNTFPRWLIYTAKGSIALSPPESTKISIIISTNRRPTNYITSSKK
jgi:hypothetical protein